MIRLTDQQVPYTNPQPLCVLGGGEGGSRHKDNGSSGPLSHHAGRPCGQHRLSIFQENMAKGSQRRHAVALEAYALSKFIP